MTSLAQSLSSLSVDWEVRCQSMHKIRELCASEQPAALHDILASLAKPLAIQASVSWQLPVFFFFFFEKLCLLE